MTNTSAADIKVPERPKGDFLSELRAMLAKCGPNKNDQVITLIDALIGQKIDSQSQLFEVGQRLGFNRGHIGAILTREIRPGGRWTFRDGRYAFKQPNPVTVPATPLPQL